MKASLILTFIILAGGATADWIIRGKRVAANETLRNATTQGAAGAPADPAAEPRQGTGRPRSAGANDTVSLTTGLLAFAKDLEAMSDKDDLATLDARQDAMLDWQRRLTGLEPEQMKELIAVIRNAPDLAGELRQSILRLMLDALIERHPLAALGIIADDPDLLDEPGWKARVTSDAMIRGLDQNPDEIIRWHREHRADFPEQTQDIIADRLLRAAGQTNPTLAFRLITDLGVKNVEYAAAAIASSARTPDQASESLAAFRDHLPALGNPQEQEAIRFEVNTALITNSFLHGYDKAVEWIDGAGFSQQELSDYIFRVRRNFRPEEAARWLGWIDETITDRTVVSQVIPDLMEDWTQMDYRAAGEWLDAQPDGDVKTAAIRRHALMMATLQPEAAARRAITMPAGEMRESTLKTVLERWQAADPSGAATFAEKHGIPR